MSAYAMPIIVTLLFWWASTGVILYLDGLSRRTFLWSMTGSTALFGVALWGMYATSAQVSCVVCLLRLCLWPHGMGLATRQLLHGLHNRAEPRALSAGPRAAGRASSRRCGTSLHHEIAIIICAGALVALTWGQPNQIGLWTFLILWWMHTSAKLNLYFGAPNLSEELLPEQLRYLATYMRRRPMNLFFPASVTVSTVVTVLIAQRALAAATPFDVVGYTILATLMALAVAEHWFLVAPLHANSLWWWGVKDIDAQDRAEPTDRMESLRVAAIETARLAGRI